MYKHPLDNNFGEGLSNQICHSLQLISHVYALRTMTTMPHKKQGILIDML